MAAGPAVPEGMELASVESSLSPVHPWPPAMTDPTRRQILQMAEKAGVANPVAAERLVRLALAAFGDPTPHPIPVSERLPGPGDIDAQGRVWAHMPDLGTAPSWRLIDPREIGPYQTHWLPAHDLPLPTTTETTNDQPPRPDPPHGGRAGPLPPAPDR